MMYNTDLKSHNVARILLQLAFPDKTTLFIYKATAFPLTTDTINSSSGGTEMGPYDEEHSLSR